MRAASFVDTVAARDGNSGICRAGVHERFRYRAAASDRQRTQHANHHQGRTRALAPRAHEAS